MGVDKHSGEGGRRHAKHPVGTSDAQGVVAATQTLSKHATKCFINLLDYLSHMSTGGTRRGKVQEEEARPKLNWRMIGAKSVSCEKQKNIFYTGKKLQTLVSAEQAVTTSSSSSVVLNGSVQQFLSQLQGSRL